MTLDDISDLLALCAQFDGRHISDDTPRAWLLLLEDIPARDAAAAVRDFYRNNPEGWFRPGHIVAYHEQQQAVRAVELVRQSPPPCSCGLAYELSARPESRFALPRGPHGEGCGEFAGVLVFDDRDGGRWGIMPVDPAAFDEVAWERGSAEVAARMARYREVRSQDPSYGPREISGGR